MEEDHDDFDAMYDEGNIDNPNPEHTESSSAKGKKRYRGEAKGLREKKEPKILEWDDLDNPIGEHKTSFANSIGKKIHANVNINYKTWKDVPQHIKEKLWDELKRKFHIDNAKKTVVLTRLRTNFKEWKAKLVSGYISCTRKMPKEPKLPYELYSAVTKEQWEQFVADRVTDEFKEKSARAKANQSHNKHPHYMGAKSYAQKGIEWRNEGRFPFTFDESNTSTPVSIHDRSWGWILGRQKKNDKGEWEIPKQETQEVVKRMEKVREDVVEGKFIPNRQDDVLSRGLERVDRPGRVAGIGGTVGHRAYFGRPEYKQKASSSASIDLDSFTQNLERKLEDRVRDILQSMGVKPPSGMDIQKGSNPESEPSIRDDPFDNLQEQTPCHLTLHSETSKKFEVVAIGSVMPTSSTVTHGIPHNSDDVRVTVDKVNSEYWMSPLPVRSPEFNHLGEAEGSFVRWPKSLVIIQKDENTSKKKLVDQNGMDRNRKGKEPENSQDATPTTMETPFCESDSYDFSDVCSKLAKIFAKDGLLKISLDKDVFGFEQSKSTFVSKEDVTNLLTDGWLNETILSVWIMSLKKRCLEKEVHTIAFLCPEDISAATINESQGNKKNAEDYMKDVMKASEDTKNFILGPYHQNNHWMLLAICPALSRVYVFDPMKMKRPLTIRNTLVMSFNLYKICGGSKLGSTLKWSAMTCAQQPQASESGYYVMRYMLDIIDNYSSCKSLFLEYERDGPFKKAEIDEVKDLWAAYVLDHVK